MIDTIRSLGYVFVGLEIGAITQSTSGIELFAILAALCFVTAFVLQQIIKETK